MINGHGDDIYKYKREIIANFSSNVYNNINHTMLYEHLKKKLSSIKSYPQPEPYTLEDELSQQLKSGTSVTNGATEAIYLIAQCFRGYYSAILAPTFSEYYDACCLHSHSVEYFTNLQNINKAISGKEKSLVWICNPNNPTGIVYPQNELLQLITNNTQTIFVIDQSYEYFTLKPTLNAQECSKLQNVILLHSMTKRFAIPGLRLGYITANNRLLQKIKQHRIPWSVNSLAIEAGLYYTQQGLPSPTDVSNLLKTSLQVRERIEDISSDSKQCFKVFDSDTHYMLVRIEQPLRTLQTPIESTYKSLAAADLKETLANQHGILIRDASNFATLNSNYFRIATQTLNENNLLIETLIKLAK